VVGFPANQFAGQEPARRGDPDVLLNDLRRDVPLFEKIDVNGEDQSPIYAELNQTADAEGYTGDVRWNFEKFLMVPTPRCSVSRHGDAGRPGLVGAIETALG